MVLSARRIGRVGRIRRTGIGCRLPVSQQRGGHFIEARFQPRVQFAEAGFEDHAAGLDLRRALQRDLGFLDAFDGAG